MHCCESTYGKFVNSDRARQDARTTVRKSYNEALKQRHAARSSKPFRSAIARIKGQFNYEAQRRCLMYDTCV
jgi:hypothetical protein